MILKETYKRAQELNNEINRLFEELNSTEIGDDRRKEIIAELRILQPMANETYEMIRKNSPFTKAAELTIDLGAKVLIPGLFLYEGMKFEHDGGIYTISAMKDLARGIFKRFERN